MNKTFWVTMLAVALIAVGGYFWLHKSKDTSTSSNQTQTQTNAGPVIQTKTDSKLGQFLADGAGKPLYTYNGDTKGVSNCTGSCLTAWPPYYASGSTGNLPANVGLIQRTDDGKQQYAYNGLPLYYFTSDSSSTPTGDGVQGFKLAKPAASQSSAPASQTPSQSSSPSYSY